jgi:hypothetical protein
MTWESEGKKETHLDAVAVLQPPLENAQNRVRLEVHHQIRTPREHPIRAFPQRRRTDTRVTRPALDLSHAERLCL